MKPYKHGKVVDDDVRQEIASVLRKHIIFPARARADYDNILQELGELYMRERWGVKGDMGLQTRVRDGALKAAEQARDQLSFWQREARIWRDAAEQQHKRSELLKETIAAVLAENPWRRAVRLTLADARTALRRLTGRPTDTSDGCSSGGGS